jgi:MerR family transcriptional regulator, mercuric resistance operon regulatory protein
VNIETVRYHQRRGLVNLPPKRARGFRYYAPETASRVRFIKRAQALGMSLKEVQRLMKLDAKGACTENRSLVASKLALEKKLVDFAKLRDVLKNLVAACDQPHGTSCPIIEQLESEIA